MWKNFIIIMFAVVIRCFGGVEGSIDDITWYWNQAVYDSTRDHYIIPGINTVTGDTLFKDADEKLNGSVLTKDQVCDWLKIEWEIVNMQIEQVSRELATMRGDSAKYDARRRLIKRYYKLFKKDFKIDCQQ